MRLAGVTPDEVTRAQADPKRIIDRYVLVEPVGKGGGGTVWKAWDGQLHRWVALKLARPEVVESHRERFLREARVAAGLHHPNLVAVYDAGEAGDQLYLVMEYVRGSPLDATGGPRRIAEILSKAARALHEAHRVGVVHRDVKPQNILVDERGDPHVVDFGLAYVPQAGALTRTGAPVGTPIYMAPEQVTGDTRRITGRTDVFALGAVLYEMLTGRVPHPGRTVPEVYHEITTGDPIPPRKINAQLPADLESICLKALEKDPELRYESAAAMGEDLASWLDGAPVAASSAGVGRAVRRVRRHALKWVLGAAVAAGFAAAAIAVVVSIGREREARRALDLSAAYQELESRSGAAMRRLEDGFHGAGDGKTGELLAQAEAAAESVGRAYPSLGLPSAWRGLARFYAGRRDGMSEIETACGRGDPFPHVLLARACWAQYVHEVSVDATPAGSLNEVALSNFEESASMAALRGRAAAALARALESDVWKRMRQGAVYEEYAQALGNLARREYGQAAEKLGARRGTAALEGEAEFLRGLALFEERRHEEACAAWESLRERGWPKAFFAAGVAHMKLAAVLRPEPSADRLAKALACFDEALGRAPDDLNARRMRAAARYGLAGVEIHLGRDCRARLDGCAADCDEAVRIAGGHPDAHRFRAWLLMLVGNAEKALRLDAAARYRSAIESADACLQAQDTPADRRLRGNIRLELAQQLAATGGDAVPEFEGAIRDFDETEKTGAPEGVFLWNRGSAHTGLAEALWRAGRDPEAEFARAADDYAQALALSPGHPAIHSQRALLRMNLARYASSQQRDGIPLVEAAIADLGASIREDPAAPLYRINRAWAFLQKGDLQMRSRVDPRESYAAAAADADALLQMQPRDPEHLRQRGLARLGRALWTLHVREDAAAEAGLALADLDASIAARDKNTDAHRDRGRLLMALGRPAEARRAFEKSLEQNPQQPQVRQWLQALE